MTAPREPLARWRFPSRDCLLGNVFPSGRPPFAPFPIVTNLLNANLCPVAVYHDLVHGYSNALVPTYGPEKQRGDIFQNFIAHLKFSLKSGDLRMTGFDAQSQIGMIQDTFLRFATRRGLSTDAATDILRLYVEPWVRRKLASGHLEIREDHHLVFELAVANSRVPYALENGTRHYPLRGRIDELDLTSGRLIERTIKGDVRDTEPPLLKDYQAWLLWKVLASLRGEQLPQGWTPSMTEGLEIVVETPYNDYPVRPENGKFLSDTHGAYAWINDIGSSESHGVAQEVYDNAACTPADPHPFCAHKFINCFTRNLPHPKSRYEIKQTFKPWYRLLLWEKIWEGDLFQYQLLQLDRDELIERGLISEGRIISHKRGNLEVEVAQEEVGSVRGYDRYTVIPDGTLFCGRRKSASLISVQDNHLTLEVHGGEDVYIRDALLMPSRSDLPSPLLQEPPTYLLSQMQKDLLRLQYSGVIKPEKATRSSLVQFLEGVFGRLRLRRGSR